jgi:hypothetical protein
VEATTLVATTPTTNFDWRAAFLAYLLDEILPVDRTEVWRIARCAKTYVAIDAELYKHSPSAMGMLMKFMLTH